MAVFRKRQKDAQPVPVMEVMASVLAGLGAAPGQGEGRARLQQLWLNWEMVMGPDLAPLARPMGHHHDLLLIGAEDAMLAQELHLMAEEILERVNAFMEQPFFSAIKVSLLMGKAGLDKTAVRTTASTRAAMPARPEPPNAHGLYLEAMDPTSPVARAYARFASLRNKG
ncbi:MAG: DUF721 domain-containing protein [Deltaproteobacteria bacterium]|nr:DUF721 domain-containing protein [Deltaproteobacteria bacterium]